MSYIKYKDNLFNKKRNEPYRRRSNPQLLKNINLCSDTRSWSLDPHENREYIFEYLRNANPSFEGRYVPPKVVIDILLKHHHETNSISKKRRRCKSAHSLVDWESLNQEKKDVNSSDDSSNESLICNSNDAASENCKINKLPKNEYILDGEENMQDKEIQVFEDEQNDRSQDQDKVENLKKLVKDLSEQVIFLEKCKSENIKLRAELEADVYQQLSEAKAENGHLSAELEACEDLLQRFNDIKETNDNLQEKCKDLKKAVKEIEQEKHNLSIVLEDQRNKFEIFKAGKQDMSIAMTERNLLLERVHTQRDKIEILCIVVMEQDGEIQKLALKIDKLSTAFSKKEERLEAKVDNFHEICEKQSQRLIEYESKLESAEIFNKELSSLRNQFKITNYSLQNQIDFYKTQFRKLAEYGFKMNDRIKMLNDELRKKDIQLKKLSIFPLTGKTVVYFAQLNNLVRNDDLINCSNPDDIKNFIKSVKLIISQLKLETWEKEEDTPFDYSDTYSQTAINIKNRGVQVEIILYNQNVQTDFPNEWALKYQNNQSEMKELCNQIKILKNSNITEQQVNATLEKKLFEAIHEKETVEFHIQNLIKKIKLINDQMENQNVNLGELSELLMKVIGELDLFVLAMSTLDNIYSYSSQNTLIEYNKYIEVLNTHIEIKEENIIFLKDFIYSEIDNIKKNEEEKIKAKERLSVALKNEKDVSNRLYNQIEILEAELCSKQEETEILDRKLGEIEGIIINFENMLNGSKSNPDLKINEKNRNHVDSKMEKEKRLESISKLVCLQSEALKKTLELRVILQKKIKGVSFSNKFLKKIISKNKIYNKDLKQKVIQLSSNIRRIKKFVIRIRTALNVSEEINLNYQVLNTSLNEEIDTLRIDNGYLIKDLEKMQVKCSEQEFNIEVKELKIAEHCKEKERMERVLSKIIRKLEKYRLICEKEVDNKSTFTNDLSENLEKTDEFKERINKLENENTELKKVIDKLKDMAEYDQTRNTENHMSVQVDMDASNYEIIIEKIKKDHEIEISSLKQEHMDELDIINKTYTNNLSEVCYTYERDMKRMKKTQRDHLNKILQQFHEEKMSYLAFADEEIATKQSKDIISIEENYKVELDKLRKEYKVKYDEQEERYIEQERIMHERNESLSKEKEAELKKKHNTMVSTIENFKQKCKQHVKKSKERIKKNMLKIKEAHAKKIFEEGLLEIKKKKLNSLAITPVEKFEIPVIPVKDNAIKKESRKNSDICNNNVYNLEKISVNYENDFTISPTVNKIFDGKLHDVTNTPFSSYNIIQKHSTYYEDNLLELIPTKGTSYFDDVYTNSNLVLWDQDSVVNRIAQLEKELLFKAQDSEQLSCKLQVKLQEEQFKNIELSSLLDYELKLGAEIKKRLALELKKGEQTHLEKQNLQRKINTLEKKIQNYSENIDTERARSFAMKLELEKVLIQQKHVNLLEATISRLKAKLEKSSDTEKKLLKDLEKEKNEKMKLEAMYRISSVINNGRKQGENSDLRVIFIQQCGILHTWGRKSNKNEIKEKSVCETP